MKKTYKILIPHMMDIHFTLLRNVFAGYGYDAELLENDGRELVEVGLQYVHNDTCYPALLTIGQIISALKSGRYDLDHTAVMMSQTGGGCRASNYIYLLRKALQNAGMGHIPVISVNLAGLEKNSGFKITLSMLRRALAAMLFGDMLMLLHNQTRPYELVQGGSSSLVQQWVNRLSALLARGKAVSGPSIRSALKKLVSSFEEIPIRRKEKVRVGIVGEIYLKYSPLANNHLEDFLASQDCEVMVPGVLGFMLYCADNPIEDSILYGGGRMKKLAAGAVKAYIQNFERLGRKALAGSRRFVVPSSYEHTKSLAVPVIGHGCKMGEGWLLTAEMMELAESGYENIVCVQPFGCLPNHIVGKGMIRRIRELHPRANIVAVDYDPGATRVNQENRIRLMLSVARENLSASHAASPPCAESAPEFAGKSLCAAQRVP
jgi:predicted nucleotide-binding protein (sugar kinase/HSP70/actin superfamily)